MSAAANIKKLTRQLYPNGRAFKIPFGGTMDRLHRALAISESRAFEDAINIRSAILPDNSDFTADDAGDWERRLGISSSSSVPLSSRKAAIIRKMNHPGTIPARQNYRYLEGQLQAAGFNVYVYENRFASSPPGTYDTQTPNQVLGVSLSGAAVYSGDTHYGGIAASPPASPPEPLRYGAAFSNKIANSIDESTDASFVIGSNYRSTFFIAGATISTFANVLASRKTEFRQLILQIKPVQTVGFLFVNYT